MTIFKGSATALITPFTQSGKIDYQALSGLIEFQIANKTDALVVLGTTGEPSTMSAAEKKAVAEFAVSRVAGRIPVILGSGGNNTAEVVKTAVLMEEIGASALLVVTPYYNKCTQNGLIEHFKALSERVKVPIIAYNVPGRTGVNLLPQTMAKLAAIENVAGIKEACGNIEQISETAMLIRGKAQLFSGDDAILVPVLSVGGEGVISVASNVIPAVMHDMVVDYLDGNIAKARDAQLKYLPFIKALFSEVNPIPVKMAASFMGLCGPYMRLPLTVMEEANVAKLSEIMHGLGLQR